MYKRQGYVWGPKFSTFSDHKALESIGKLGDHNARVQRWLRFLTPLDYTLAYHTYHTGNANGNADFLSRWAEPATEHDRTESSSLTPVIDSGMFLIQACGLRTHSSPIPGASSSGLIPRPESTVLGGLPFASLDFPDFRTHGPCMRIDDVSAPSGKFAARLTAAVTTDYCRLGREECFSAADTAFASVFAVPSEGGTGSAEGPAAATSFARHAPPSSNISQGANPAAITDPAASAPSPRGDPALPLSLIHI